MTFCHPNHILHMTLFLCYTCTTTRSILTILDVPLFVISCSIIFTGVIIVNNKLSLHLGKTECILFGPKRKLKDFQNFTICCNNHVINATDHVKYLGVYIDNSLSGELIVDSVVQKVNSRLKFLYRQARFLDFKCKMSLCASLIQCHIDYACSAWYSGLSKRFKQKLQICQNKMVRFICGFSPRQSVNYSVLSSLNMLCVEDRVKQLRLNHVFNIYHNTAPSYLV